jgi:hypothetical protein
MTDEATQEDYLIADLVHCFQKEQDLHQENEESENF